MKRRLGLLILASATFALALATTPARAAIRFTISDGIPADTQIFTSASSNIGVFSTTIDGYEIVANTITSNFPGLASGANLIQSININDFNPDVNPLPTLTFLAEIVTSTAPGAPLLLFTAPSAAVLQVSSDVTNVSPVFQPPGGSVQNITTVNGVAVPSAVVPLNGSAPSNQGFVADGAGFTLSSTIIISGLATGTSISVGGTSSIIAAPQTIPGVPEPSSLIVVGLGGTALAFWAAKRRRKTTAR